MLAVHLGKGILALFCAACPQPGINLPEGWEDDPEEWKYTQSFVADGNFTCIHRRQRKEEEFDVGLKNGEGYMTEAGTYTEHLRIAEETSEATEKPPTCHEHRAIADKSKVRKGLDVTGIGAIACMRHGAFAPGSVVDFQKGERQINMDYALSEALQLTNMEQTRRVILADDINCQYSKHLLRRLREGDHLKLNEDLIWVFGIGLFHVHGHQEACHAQYSLTFIRGAGVSAGEILESLWAVVNEVARSTSTMSLAHRAKVLDAIMGDINWKKMLRLIPLIPKDWKNARMQLSSAREDFELLNETATTEQTERWQEQLNAAQEAHIHDVSAMDVLNVKVSKAPSFANVRTRLMEAEKRAGQDVGLTSWIAFGFKIQEAQVRLRSYLQTLPKERTEAQEVEVAQRREQLYTDVNSLYEMATSLFPDSDLSALKYDEPPVGEDVQLEDEDDALAGDDNPYSLSQNNIENVKLPLPSSLAQSDVTPSLQRAKEKELTLRIAQAEDALESIRNDIGHKSYLYRSNI
ncbi:hypothetical protein CC2G_001319 [Coprinopsis cinerea AmutBmut pab1-1]|nr:hypothetical protein CC2G_001319 [Coprinopsis cinerea AmutBmut pab1-1]